MLDISRVTVRKALAELVEDGVLTQKRGSGTFVTAGSQRVEQRLSRLTSFTEDMLARGLTPSVKWLQKIVAAPSPEEAMVLGLSTGERVVRLRRLRLANDKPMALEQVTALVAERQAGLNRSREVMAVSAPVAEVPRSFLLRVREFLKL